MNEVKGQQSNNCSACEQGYRWICVSVVAISVVGALGLALTDNGHSWFPHLGAYLGLLLLGAGNLLSFFLNVCYLKLFKGPSWLKAIVLAQAVPALCCLLLFGQNRYEDWENDRRWEQVQRIDDEITADSLDGYLAAVNLCEEQCRHDATPGRDLLIAAESGSHKIAAYLIGPSSGTAVKSSDEYHTRVFETCEGTTIHALDPLSIAVVRADQTMLELLFPLADGAVRTQAMLMAARLDRLSIAQRLNQLGVPISTHGDVYYGQFLSKDRTLLALAADSAALEVGRWLLENRVPTNLTLEEKRANFRNIPLAALLESDDYSIGRHQRVEPFLKMLLAHGADVNANEGDGESLLTHVIARGNEDAARILTSAGANVGALDSKSRIELEKLLVRSPRERFADRQDAECVRLGSAS